MSYGRSVLVSIGFAGLMCTLALANNVVIARMVGPEGRGIYGLAVAIAALAAPIASLGLGPALTWQRGRDRPPSELEGLGLIVFGLISLLGLSLASGVRLLGEHTGVLVIVAAALIVPAQVHVELVRGLLLGDRRVLGYNLVAALQVAGLLTLNLVLLDRGADWVLIDLVLAHWLAALGLLGLRPRLLASPPRWPSPALIRESLAYGRGAAMLALVDVGLLRLDLLIAAPALGLPALGVYAIADQIAQLLAWGGLLAGKMMLPESAGDPEGRRSFDKLGLACRLQLASLVIAGVLLSLIGRPLIVLLFGPAFDQAWLLLVILMPAAIARSLASLISTWLAGRGIQAPLVRLGAIAIAVEIVGVLALIPWLGPVGVALGKSLAYLVQLGLVLRVVRAHQAARLRWLLDRDDRLALRRWFANARQRSP
ncbi:lipopolysaccharide biosynthesis protein [Nannocystaceae bacterium ST9]